jgi:hypothetical protein
VSGTCKTLSIVSIYEDRSDGTQLIHFQAAGFIICDVISGGGAPQKINYFHQDRLSTIWLVTNENGVRVQRIEYDPFGNSVLVSGTIEPHWEFTGQEEDTMVDHGFYFYNAR